MSRYDDTEWLHTLSWWTVWHHAAKYYAYRYMCCTHKRGNPVALEHKRRFERCRERMAAAAARLEAREKEL